MEIGKIQLLWNMLIMRQKSCDTFIVMFGFYTQVSFGSSEHYDLPPWQDQIQSNSNKVNSSPNHPPIANVMLNRDNYALA